MPVGGGFSGNPCNGCNGRGACEYPTQPVAVEGYCIGGNEPVLLVVTRDCCARTTVEGYVTVKDGRFHEGEIPEGIEPCQPEVKIDGESIQIDGLEVKVDNSDLLTKLDDLTVKIDPEARVRLDDTEPIRVDLGELKTALEALDLNIDADKITDALKAALEGLESLTAEVDAKAIADAVKAAFENATVKVDTSGEPLPVEFDADELRTALEAAFKDVKVQIDDAEPVKVEFDADALKAALETAFNNSTVKVDGPVEVAGPVEVEGTVKATLDEPVTVKLDDELNLDSTRCQTLPMHDGSCTEFLRTTCRDADGAIVSVEDTHLDATTPYTPTGANGEAGDDETACVSLGPSEHCDCDESGGESWGEYVDENGLDCEPLILHDANGSFLRTICYDSSGQEVSRRDETLNGETYQAEGDVHNGGGGGGGNAVDCETIVLRDGKGPFLRVICYKNGSEVSRRDETLNGETYQAQGDVKPVNGGGGGGGNDDGNKGCTDTHTVLVCELAATGKGKPTATDADPTPYAGSWGSACINPVRDEDIGTAPLWNGGSITVPGGSKSGRCSTLQDIMGVAATLGNAPRPNCDTGTATVWARIAVTNNGPKETSSGYTGTLRIHRKDTGEELARSELTLSSMAVDETRYLDVSARVPAALLSSGQVVVVQDCEVWQSLWANTGTSFTFDDFAATYEYNQEGCDQSQGGKHQIIRTIRTDCETGKTTVTDTDLRGEPIEVEGEIANCSGSGGGGGGGGGAHSELGVDVELVQLCIMNSSTGEVHGRALSERIYDSKSGTLKSTRIIDPATGATRTLDTGQHLAVCPPNGSSDNGGGNTDDESSSEAQQRVDVELDALCIVDNETEKVRGQVLAERIYDAATGELLRMRPIDPTTGEPADIPGDAHLTACPAGGSSGGEIDLTAAFTICETVVMHDDVRSFARVICRDRTGSEVSRRDETLNGETYEAEGDVRPGPLPDDAGEQECCPTITTLTLCDDEGPFLRHVTRTLGGETTVADTTLDGQTYTAAGDVHVCPTAPRDCPTSETVDLCDTYTAEGTAELSAWTTSGQASLKDDEVWFANQTPFDGIAQAKIKVGAGEVTWKYIHGVERLPDNSKTVDSYIKFEAVQGGKIIATHEDYEWTRELRDGKPWYSKPKPWTFTAPAAGEVTIRVLDDNEKATSPHKSGIIRSAGPAKTVTPTVTKFQRTTVTNCDQSAETRDTRNGMPYTVQGDVDECDNNGNKDCPTTTWQSCTDTLGRIFSRKVVVACDGTRDEQTSFDGKPYIPNGETACTSVDGEDEAREKEEDCHKVTEERRCDKYPSNTLADLTKADWSRHDGATGPDSKGFYILPAGGDSYVETVLDGLPAGKTVTVIYHTAATPPGKEDVKSYAKIRIRLFDSSGKRITNWGGSRTSKGTEPDVKRYSFTQEVPDDGKLKIQLWEDTTDHTPDKGELHGVMMKVPYIMNGPDKEHPFVRTTTVECDGTETVTDTTPDGKPYDLVLKVVDCTDPGPVPPKDCPTTAWQSCTDDSGKTFTKKTTTPCGGGGADEIERTLGAQPYELDGTEVCTDVDGEDEARDKEEDCPTAVWQSCRDTRDNGVVTFTKKITTPCGGADEIERTLDGKPYTVQGEEDCADVDDEDEARDKEDEDLCLNRTEWHSCQDVTDAKTVTFTKKMVLDCNDKVLETIRTYGGKPYKLKGDETCTSVDGEDEARDKESEEEHKVEPTVEKFTCTETVQTGGKAVPFKGFWRNSLRSTQTEHVAGLTCEHDRVRLRTYHGLDAIQIHRDGTVLKWSKPVTVGSFYMSGFEPNGETVKVPDGVEPSLDKATLRLMGFEWDASAGTLGTIRRGGARVSTKIPFKGTKPITEMRFTYVKRHIYAVFGQLTLAGTSKEVTYTKIVTTHADGSTKTRYEKGGKKYTPSGTNQSCKPA